MLSPVKKMLALMRLKTKIIFLPILIITIGGIFAGTLFFSALENSSKRKLQKGISDIIELAEKQLLVSLAVIAGTSLPADVYIGLVETDGEEPSREAFLPLEKLGFDSIYIADLEGKIRYTYPEKRKAARALPFLLKHTDPSQRIVHIKLLENRFLGYIPIIDIDQPMGFLVFEVIVPSEVVGMFMGRQGRMAEAMNSQNKISETIKKSLTLEKTEALQTQKNILILIVLFVFSSVFVLGAILYYVVSHGLIHPIQLFVTFIAQLNEGKLTSRLGIQSRDELGEMSGKMNAFVSQFQETIETIHQNSDTLSAVCHQLSTTTQELDHTAAEVTQGLDQSAGASFEASNTLRDLASSIRETTHVIHQIQTQAVTAEKDAKSGAEAVGMTIEAIEKISESSQKITSVTEVLNGISNQTNLLSLNAAIEAAKAGEFGKGFSVVAEEVRALAEKSRGSMESIHELITVSLTHVGEGKTVVQATGNALYQVIEQVRQISSQVHTLVKNIEEQDRQIQEVALAAEEISTVSEGNATAMNEFSQTIKQVDGTTVDLRKMAEELRQQISGFET